MPGWWAETVLEPVAAVVSVLGGDPGVEAEKNWFLTPGAAGISVAGGVPSLLEAIGVTAAPVAVAGGTPATRVGRILLPGQAVVGVSGGVPLLRSTVSPSSAGVSVAGGTPNAVVKIPVSYGTKGNGTGNSGAGTSWSFSHTASAGDYVIVDIASDRNTAISSITYGGTAMTLLGSVYHGNNSTYGVLYRYGIASVPGGAQTVAITQNTGAWCEANSVSYKNVGTVGTTQSVYGTGTSVSQSATCNTGERIVQSFAYGLGGGTAISNALSGLTGGTLRFNQVSVQYNTGALALQDSGSSATFTGTLSTSRNWSGLVTVLS